MSLFKILEANPFWAAVAGYWLLSAIVSSLEPPDEKDGKGYKFVYKFLHTIAGNIFTAFGSKIPGLK